MAHKTENGNWKVRWRDKAEGIMRARTFTRKVDAQKFEAELKLGIQIGQDLNTESTRFEDFAKIWMRDHCLVHKAPTQQLNDASMLRIHLEPVWGKHLLRTLQHKDLVDLQSKLKHAGNLRPKSINNISGLARKMMEDAVDWNFLDRNPFRRVKPLPTEELPVTYWSLLERDRFLSFCKHEDFELYQVVAMAVHTGMRLGEIEGLYRDCVDFASRTITVRRNYNYLTRTLYEFTKSKRIRRVPMNDAITTILSDKQLLSPTQKIFSNPFHSLVQRRFKPMAKRAGVNVICFHELRHSFASNLVEAGVPLYYVQALLGHRFSSTTEKYAHLAPDNLKGMTEVLSGVPEAVPDKSKEVVKSLELKRK